VDWWQKVFSIPVYASDGSTIVNPQFDEAPTHALPSDSGGVEFLFGSFFTGVHQRTATVPANTPIFVPVFNTEWSNADTADPDGTLPGHWTASQLAAFAAGQMDATSNLHASVDSQDVPDMFSHRETSPIFSYTLPKNYSIDQVFFGENIKKVSPAAADGFYVMLQPLSAGQHTVNFGGNGSGFKLNITYHLDVVSGQAPAAAASTPVGGISSPFSGTTVVQDVLVDSVAPTS
jgi:hypothetical protein